MLYSTRSFMSLFLALIMLLSHIPLIPSTYAATQASCDVNLGASTKQFLNEEFFFTLSLDNTGDISTDTGFAPYAEIILPPSVIFDRASYS